MFMDQIPINKLKAFKHYVEVWKKQDVNTVTVEGDIYSYTTKRGVVKKFRNIKVTKAPIKVNGFGFEPIQ